MKNYIPNASRIFSNVLLLCTLSFLSCGIGFSQTNDISTIKVTFLPDTSTLGATVPMVVQIRNVGTSTYAGPIDINWSTDTNSFFQTGLCASGSVTLTPNGADSATSNCTITFDSTNGFFHQGDNIVVVWSSGNARAPHDSLWVHVYLDSSHAGVHETTMSSAFKIYPSPTQDFINVEYSGNIAPLKIFIEDISGRIINAVSPSRDSKNLTKVNTSGLNTGIYFLDILLPDKQRVISKFVKEE